MNKPNRRERAVHQKELNKYHVFEIFRSWTIQWPLQSTDTPDSFQKGKWLRCWTTDPKVTGLNLTTATAGSFSKAPNIQLYKCYMLPLHIM